MKTPPSLPFYSGIPKRTLTYLISTLFAIFGTGLLFIGVVIWTVLIHKAETINKAQVRHNFPMITRLTHSSETGELFRGGGCYAASRNSCLCRLWSLAILGGIRLPLPVCCSLPRQVRTVLCYYSLRINSCSVVALTEDKL